MQPCQSCGIGVLKGISNAPQTPAVLLSTLSTALSTCGLAALHPFVPLNRSVQSLRKIVTLIIWMAPFRFIPLMQTCDNSRKPRNQTTLRPLIRYGGKTCLSGRTTRKNRQDIPPPLKTNRTKEPQARAIWKGEENRNQLLPNYLLKVYIIGRYSTACLSSFWMQAIA